MVVDALPIEHAPSSIGDMQVRDVVVVVSRWYGGTLLGPMRFTLINNAARMLLEDCGYDNRDTKAAGRSAR